MGPVSRVTFIYVIHVGHSTLCGSWMETGAPRGPGDRRLLALMVGTSGSLVLTPPRGAVINVCYVDGGLSRISISTSQGGVVDFS
jgi:hypothetical protein